jgi:hypothetical protein
LTNSPAFGGYRLQRRREHVCGIAGHAGLGCDFCTAEELQGVNALTGWCDRYPGSGPDHHRCLADDDRIIEYAQKPITRGLRVGDLQATKQDAEVVSAEPPRNIGAAQRPLKSARYGL